MYTTYEISSHYLFVSCECEIFRNDVKEKHLSAFFDWVVEQSLASNSNVFVKYGTLACIAVIIKHGKREDMLPHASKLLSWIINSEFKESSGTSVQKLVYKIIQRIGKSTPFYQINEDSSYFLGQYLFFLFWGFICFHLNPGCVFAVTETVE